MPAPTTRRLAGIRFEDRTPPPPQSLPRMDIAVFVGFAATGPLHRPVPIEDAAHFADLFGEDLPLAWDAEKGEQAFANLAPAVRAFFRNGGRRCWVVRVAGAAETSFFPLPGLARLRGDQLEPAFARARSVGSGFDQLRAATSLTVRAIEVLGCSEDFTHLDVRISPRHRLRAGDLVRLKFTPERLEGFFLVQAVTPSSGSPPDTTRHEINIQPLGWLSAVTLEQTPLGSFTASWDRQPGQPPEEALGEILAPDESPLDLEPRPLTLSLEPVFRPPPGSLLRVQWESLDPLWFYVDEIQTGANSGRSDRGTFIQGRGFRWSLTPPYLPLTTVPLAEKLTFELRACRGDLADGCLTELGFAPSHPRYWNALPDDPTLFVGDDFRSSVEKASAQAWEEVWQEVAEPRFPLAGDLGPDIFIPFAMGVLPKPYAEPQHGGATALERDGLATFSSTLLLDGRLVASAATSLLGEADFLRYQIPEPRPFTGIHAALDIEEATLFAVPDAMHRGWSPAPIAELPPAAAPPIPRPHPSWWHFLPCDPPSSPPAEAETPERGQFLKCSLRVLAAPILSLLDPDPAAGFTLNWSSPQGDNSWTMPEPNVVFVLEEATQADFAGAVELLRTDGFTHTVSGRPTGHFYYRVRAEADGESSNWSNGVAISTLPAVGWQLNSVENFQADVLLDVHRALLRLCAARGDVLAVLGLPEHFREDDMLGYSTELKTATSTRPVTSVFPLGGGEAHAFSYAAVYHPWLITREEQLRLRATSPDGAAAGVIARRSISRGAWIAPANEPLAAVVALTPSLAPARHLDLLLAQLNVVRHEPRGFLALSADTLSLDPELRPINVRRLLILLRRAAMRLGMTYVFEPNDRTLRRVVQGAFESLLQRLFVGGAFAGATTETAFQVDTSDNLNPPESTELGRFRVDLKVAPSLPMSFLTVRLMQIGERTTITELL